MKILKEGKVPPIPPPKIARKICDKCGCHFEFTMNECSVPGILNYNGNLWVVCPTEGCGRGRYVHINEFYPPDYEFPSRA